MVERDNKVWYFYEECLDDGGGRIRTDWVDDFVIGMDIDIWVPRKEKRGKRRILER